jgi:uncharacterized protein YndB with AHSA1/START domain
MVRKKGLTNRHPLGIEKSVEIDAPAKAVFDAVSTADGLRGWWCKDTTGSDAKGGELKLRFGGGHSTRISLAKATAPTRVGWNVLDHRPMREWDGTYFQFSIEKGDRERTTLRFLHAGLGPECECYAACGDAWDYLMGSIKNLVEKGEGGAV